MARYKWPEAVRVQDKIDSVRHQLEKYDCMIRTSKGLPEESAEHWAKLMTRYYTLIDQFQGIERKSNNKGGIIMEEYIREKDGFLEIRLKVGKGTLSRSGKSLLVATTNGFTPVQDSSVRVSLNAIKQA